MVNGQTLLDNFMNREFELEPSTPSNEYRPVGWDRRERFGINMRYWPSLSMVFDLTSSEKSYRGVPKYFRNCFIDQMEPKNRDQAMVMDMMNVMATRRHHPLLFLMVCGGNGTGKTYLGCGVVNTLARLAVGMDKDGNQEDLNAMYVNEADLLPRITGWGQKDWFSVYSEQCEFLVIDEFAMTQWSATDTKRMEQLLNKRFSNGFRTVVLTNRGIDEIQSVVSSQMISRFKTGRILSLTGEDLRERWTEDEGDDPF